MEDEIRAEFKKNGFVIEEEEEILNKCLTFCINYKLSPSDLVSSWEVFSLNRQLEVTVQGAHMDAFLLHLQNEKKEEIAKKEPGLHLYSNDLDMLINNDDEEMKEAIIGTPNNRSDVPDQEPLDSTNKINGDKFSPRNLLESITPFGLRKSKFVVQSTLNDLANVDSIKTEPEQENLEDDIIKRVQPSARCSLTIHGSRPEPGCRFMYEKIEDKFNFLEKRIGKFATALTSSGQCEELVDPTVASQKTVSAVGMICCDEEGRLKEKPILLQSSVEHSGGQRVRLDLQKLSHFSIFPGQIVGVEGHNPSGHYLIASKVIGCIPVSVFVDDNPNPTKKQEVAEEFQLPYRSNKLAELSMVVAAGPFTTSDNLFFEPLIELLAYARRKQPQLLLLMGPFIDSEHPEIKKGTVNKTFDEIFRLEILGRLQDYVEYMGSSARVILVPSVRDANHDFVFPQPPFDIQPPDLRNQITSLTNPGTFSANEVNIGCCTVDILKHLSGEEISRNSPGGAKQRMNRLANHLLSQRSFYPLYPPAEGTPLDFTLAPEALQISSIPDILILSSDLAHFVKVLKLGEEIEGEEQTKCICVNPGRLARGEGAGFFVEMNYKGSPDSTSASIISI